MPSIKKGREKNEPVGGGGPTPPRRDVHARSSVASAAGQAADQAGPEQTRSKLFGYQPDPVGCHLILREQKPAERMPWRVRIACGPQCTQELRVVRRGVPVVN